MTLRGLMLAAAFASAPITAAAGAAPAATPEYWVISGLRDGASLNVRASASTDAEILIRLGAGTILRNLGCLPSGAWCRVQSPDGITIDGWVAARFLAAGAAPPPADALVAGTRYNATGEIRCTLVDDPAARTCRFGVVRSPGSHAAIFITWPDGTERLVEFRNGEPVAPDGVPMVARKVDDTTFVDLRAGAEVYEIVDVIYLGD